MGATISSEKTAAAEGTVGELRRDPFAMLPFCGYNMADYWDHWLEIGDDLGENAPKIFQVNWFRKDADGRFIWPGFGDNSRVLDWIIRRVAGDVAGEERAIGRVPAEGEMNLDGLNVTQADMAELFDVDAASWRDECDLTETFFEQFNHQVPQRLRDELQQLRHRLSN
jgi:phosphoenolpyruvate carboxykinase (GTP)